MGKSNNTRIIVGLSGGIDSSVSLLLLKKQGYEPIGLTLKYDALQNKESIKIARKICEEAKVPHYILDCKKEFKKKVIGYFSNLLKKGKTPSPCIICNHLVKFKSLFNFARKKGAQYVATGHYARIKNNQLLRAKDKEKDQSYFLCLLRQKQLKKIIFPLGDLTKKEVYKIAKKEKLNFIIKQKQSQDLCFTLPKMISNPGQIINQKGSILGEHKGLHLYTIGQRKGIQLSNGPWWVIGFNKKKNQLIVTNKENDPVLYKKEVVLTNAHFISGQPFKKIIKVKAKTRFNQSLALAKFYPNSSKLIFEKPQKAVTPGQWAVFYNNKVCLGSGMIK